MFFVFNLDSSYFYSWFLFNICYKRQTLTSHNKKTTKNKKKSHVHNTTLHCTLINKFFAFLGIAFVLDLCIEKGEIEREI